MKSSNIRIRAISQEMPQPSLTKIHLKITCLKFHSNFPGPNELTLKCHWLLRFALKENQYICISHCQYYRVLLLMTWWVKEPGHQLAWYWTIFPGIFQFQHNNLDTIGPQFDIDLISIQHFHVGSMSYQCRSEGLWCVDRIKCHHFIFSNL